MLENGKISKKKKIDDAYLGGIGMIFESNDVESYLSLYV